MNADPREIIAGDRGIGHVRSREDRAYLENWLKDGVAYAPHSALDTPNPSPWAFVTSSDGYKVVVCPHCQRRMYARGLRLPGGGWGFLYDLSNECCSVCDRASSAKDEDHTAGGPRDIDK